MLGLVKEISGQKTIIPLTTDTGTGAPVGTLISQYKKVPMSGYLYCDGSTFDETAYPALYLYLGTNVLPDYRECVMVGAEQNTTDTIAVHDVYTQGQFKDDQLQDHTHLTNRPWPNPGQSWPLSSGSGWQLTGQQTDGVTTTLGARSGDVTHGKQKAVFVYIKATSGLAENQQENVLNAVKNYVSPSLVYSATGIEVYRQAGTYTFNFRGCNLTAYQTAISAVLNGRTLPHQWTAFISRRNAANNDIFPGTVVVATDLYVSGWYSNGSGVETQMNMADTMYGNAIIIVAD